jgi:hypothetical protein
VGVGEVDSVGGIGSWAVVAGVGAPRAVFDVAASSVAVDGDVGEHAAARLAASRLTASVRVPWGLDKASHPRVGWRDTHGRGKPVPPSSSLSHPRRLPPPAEAGRWGARRRWSLDVRLEQGPHSGLSPFPEQIEVGPFGHAKGDSSRRSTAERIIQMMPTKCNSAGPGRGEQHRGLAGGG